MTRPLLATLLLAAASLLAGCATAPAPLPPVLQRRLAPAWIDAAEKIESGRRTVYFHGQARGAIAGGAWSGVVRGEILALDPAMAIVIPSGTLTLTPRQELRIAGEQHVITSDAPAWRSLLRP